jgi:hypothetical protein
MIGEVEIRNRLLAMLGGMPADRRENVIMEDGGPRPLEIAERRRAGAQRRYRTRCERPARAVQVRRRDLTRRVRFFSSCVSVVPARS